MTAFKSLDECERAQLANDFRDYLIDGDPMSGPHNPSISSCDRIKDLTGVDVIEIVSVSAQDDVRRRKSYWRDFIRDM